MSWEWLCGDWLCSHSDMLQKVWRKKGKGTNMRKRNWWKSKKSNEEVEKGQDERDKSQTGQGEKERERDRDRLADRWNKEGRGGRMSHRGRELYCLCACWKPSLSSCCCFWTWVSTVTEWRPLCVSVPLLACNIHQMKQDKIHAVMTK